MTPGRNCANLRLLFGYMYAHPGKKLLFMGGEFGQWKEWNHEAAWTGICWSIPLHQGIQGWVRDLNHFYRAQPALHQLDFSAGGLRMDGLSRRGKQCIHVYAQGSDRLTQMLVVCNFTPVRGVKLHRGRACGGRWREVLNSDAELYGGAGFGNAGGVDAAPVAAQGKFHSLYLTLPPLAWYF